MGWANARNSTGQSQLQPLFNPHWLMRRKIPLTLSSKTSTVSPNKSDLVGFVDSHVGGWWWSHPRNLQKILDRWIEVSGAPKSVIGLRTSDFETSKAVVWRAEIQWLVIIASPANFFRDPWHQTHPNVIELGDIPFPMRPSSKGTTILNPNISHKTTIFRY